ncbi:MAG: MBL fold metallo-hydrolase [Ignavibacteriaceae bacterium]|nr:MBL fold metallo-hydrolase [Ignavibacteriaceae bacterium]
MYMLPIGGANEIGANSYYLNIAGTGIILDCGMHPQKTGLAALPQFDLLNNLPVDYVLITHAHQDHLSALPYLVQRHPYIKIITTPQTRALAELTLHNSVSILRGQIENDEIKIYSHEEVDLLIQSIDYKEYEKTFEITGYSSQSTETVKVTFFDAGHILGSASIFIEHDGKSIYYTGDINNENQMLQPQCTMPKVKSDILIIETTYGSTDSQKLLSWEKESERMALSINKIFNNNGSVLIPVFALGKMQEILATLWHLIEKCKLVQTDIYIGGVGEKINRVYDYNRYVVRRTDKEFQLNSILTKSFYEIKRTNDFFKHPCIVLAASGMVIAGTPSYKFAKQWLSQKNSAIFTVGYMEETTPGYILANAKRKDKIKLTPFMEPMDVKCSIKNFKFSAHAKREGLLKIVQKINPQKIILVHGDPDSIDWVGAAILKKDKSKIVYAAECGKKISLI